MDIIQAKITPNEVYTGGSFIISVSVTDPSIWLLDNNELFLTDSAGVFLQAKEE